MNPTHHFLGALARKRANRLPSGAIGYWKGATASGKVVSNAKAATPASTRLNIAHRRLFATSYYTRNLVTAVDGSVVDPVTGNNDASALTCSAGSWYIQPVGQAAVSLPAAQYTLSVWVRRAAAEVTDQSFRLTLHSTTSSTLTATASWQRFTLTVTAGSTLSVVQILHASSAAANLEIVDLELWSGAAPGTTQPLAGHLALSLSASITGGYMDFGTVAAGGLMQWPSAIATGGNLTVMGLIRKTATSSGFVSLLSKVQSRTDFSAELENSGLPAPYWNGSSSGYNAAVTTNSYSWLSKGWHTCAVRSGGGETSIWIDGHQFRYKSSSGTPTLQDLFVSVPLFGSYGQGYHFKSLALWDRALTDAEIQRTHNVLASDAGVAVTKLNFLAAEGDSLTAFDGTSGTSYWYLYLSHFGAGTDVLTINQAAGGNTMTNVNARLPGLLKMAPPSGSGSKAIVSILITNGLTSDTTGFISTLQTYVATLQAAGFQTVVGTLPPRSGATHNTYRAVVNTAIRTWPGLGICSAVADYAADATMGPDAAASDTMLYYDGTHPTAAGQAILEPIYRAAVNSLLVSP